MAFQIVTSFTTTADGNLAYHIGDDEKNVDKNRQNLAKKLGYKSEDLVYMDQVHSNKVVIVDKNSPKLIEKCDAIITKSRNLPLMVMVADCIPILIYDEKIGVIAAIHAGRNSTFLKISQIVAQKMVDEFFCKAEDLVVLMGPSIQKCCYEVDEKLKNIIKNSFGQEFVFGNNIDLQGINKKLLNDLGVKNIKISHICTKCSNEPYFSYRKEVNTGRFAGIIEIKD